MEIIEKEVLETDHFLVLVSDSTNRRFNIMEFPDYVDISKEEQIDWSKVDYIYFERMVSENKAREIYDRLKRN